MRKWEIKNVCSVGSTFLQKYIALERDCMSMVCKCIVNDLKIPYCVEGTNSLPELPGIWSRGSIQPLLRNYIQNLTMLHPPRTSGRPPQFLPQFLPQLSLAQWWKKRSHMPRRVTSLLSKLSDSLVTEVFMGAIDILSSRSRSANVRPLFSGAWRLHLQYLGEPRRRRLKCLD